MLIALTILVVAVALILVGFKATRAGYESAPCVVVRSSDSFAVRDYPSLSAVEAPRSGVGSDSDGSFSPLLGFITGGNTAHQRLR